VTGDRLRDLLEGGWFRDGLLAGLAAGFAFGLIGGEGVASRDRRVATGAAVLVSLLAAGGAYACTPDTELARLLTGAVVGGGAAASAAGLSWWWPSWLVRAALLVIAAHDGAPRASAVVGTVAIAALHALGQLQLRGGARPVVAVPVVGVAIAVCSRVAGLAGSAAAATLVAGVAGLAAVVALAVLGAPLRSTLRRGAAGSDHAA
jgi:hypothetical protein